MMMASAKLVRDCSSDLSSDVRSLSVASSTEEQESTTTESEFSEEEKEYELDDLQILKTIGEHMTYLYLFTYVVCFCTKVSKYLFFVMRLLPIIWKMFVIRHMSMLWAVRFYLSGDRELETLRGETKHDQAGTIWMFIFSSGLMIRLYDDDNILTQ